MVIEALSILLAWLVLALIGIGPALWLISPGEKRLLYALGTAPALGLAVLCLIALPLVRYVAPARTWTFPAIAFLCLTSAALVYLAWRSAKSWTLVPWRRLLIPVGFILIVYFVLILPLIVRGIQFAIFQSNPSDAFVFMSLAETQRVVDWKTLAAGANFSPSNLEALERLGAMSPTALFSARMVAFPVPLSAPGTLAWFAELTQLPVYRLYYAHHLLMLLLALPLALALGNLLNLSRLKYLTATAAILGFWVQYALAQDKGYELTSFPLLLLVTFAWIQLECLPLRMFNRERLLLALSGTVLALVYFAITPVLFMAATLYYLARLGQRAITLRPILYHLLTLGMGMLLLILTGQLDYQLSILQVTLFDAPEVERKLTPEILEIMAKHGPAAVWGLPTGLILPGALVLAQPLIFVSFTAIALALTAAIAFGIIRWVRGAWPAPVQIMLAYGLGGFLLGGLLLALGILHAAGRAVTFIMPYLILGASASIHSLACTSRRAVRAVHCAHLKMDFGKWGKRRPGGASILLGDTPKPPAVGTPRRGIPTKLHPVFIRPLGHCRDVPPERPTAPVHALRSWAIPLNRIPNWTCLGRVILVSYLAIQTFLGLYLPFTDLAAKVSRRDFKSQDFNLSAIVDYLDRYPPRALLVYVPDTDGWVFPYYVTFVFARYPAYFQSGLIVDNRANAQNVWVDALRVLPDYAVISKTADYIGGEGLGVPVVDTRDLVLYRITVRDLTPFRAQEQRWRAIKADKPFFSTNRRSNFIIQ